MVRFLAVPRQPGTLSRQMKVTTTKIPKQGERSLVEAAMFSRTKAEWSEKADTSSWEGILLSELDNNGQIVRCRKEAQGQRR